MTRCFNGVDYSSFDYFGPDEHVCLAVTWVHADHTMIVSASVDGLYVAETYPTAY